MQSKYFGLITFSQAVHFQEIAWQRARSGLGDCVLGFELQPTITLGARATDEDLLWSKNQWSAHGFEVHRADRGGQATIHNPGQLVIFPVVNVREMGIRRFVDLLAKSTQVFLTKMRCNTRWNSCEPGLYTSGGKVVSLGLRVRGRISTHGLAINVHNNLEPFLGIRICGKNGLAVDRVHTELGLDELFSSWCGEFTAQLTAGAASGG